MNHLKQIAAGLDEYGLDAMLITSQPGERYALGFHGEGLVLVTPQETHYTTDGRYIEAAREQIAGARISLVSAGSGHLAQARAYIQEHGLKKVGFESGAMTVDAHARYARELPCTLVPAQGLLDGLRARGMTLSASLDADFSAMCADEAAFLRQGKLREKGIKSFFRRSQRKKQKSGGKRLSFGSFPLRAANVLRHSRKRFQRGGFSGGNGTQKGLSKGQGEEKDENFGNNGNF